jgi:hypothetical protein
MRRLHLFLAVAGAVLLYVFFVSFLVEHGFDLPVLVDQLFANDISTFFAVDLIITALVFWAFLVREARALGTGNAWVYLVATLLVGPSFALPLFLYVREGRLASADATGGP